MNEISVLMKETQHSLAPSTKRGYNEKSVTQEKAFART